CGGWQYARASGIPTLAFPVNAKLPPSEQMGLTPDELLAAMRHHGVDYVVLAGYLKLLPASLVEAFPRAILNIHPALLPAFGGKGYYGMRVHKAVIASGARVSGPTVHFVDERYDHGPIAAQAVVPVLPSDDPQSLQARVLAQEHRVYARVVAALCDGRVEWREDGVPLIRTSKDGNEFEYHPGAAAMFGLFRKGKPQQQQPQPPPAGQPGYPPPAGYAQGGYAPAAPPPAGYGGAAGGYGQAGAYGGAAGGGGGGRAQMTFQQKYGFIPDSFQNIQQVRGSEERRRDEYGGAGGRVSTPQVGGKGGLNMAQVQDKLREVGLESSNLIVAVDFTKSNEWTGKHTFGGRCLHTIGPHMNPYEQAIQIIGETLEPFDEDNLIPAFGFGDATTHDKAVFSFNRDNRSCNGIAETLSRYRAIAPHVKLSGPTSFAPAIDAAVRIVEESGGNYHVLLIIADGQVTRSADVPPGQLSKQERATVDAIVAASNYALSIVLVGVGDGPWDVMHGFDDLLPARAFDNFQFVDCSQILAAPGPHEQKAVRFALSALMEVPLQFKACSEMGVLGKRIGRMPPTPPLPPPPRVLEMDAAAASGMGMGYQQQQQQQPPPYGQQQPPPYYQQQQQPYPGAPLSSYPTAPSAPPAPDQFSSQEGGYPPPQGGYGQQSAYPPQQGGYSSQQGGYPRQPNQQGGYLPQQGGYSSQPGGYPAQQGNNPPQQGGYSSQPGSYPPQHAGSPTQQGGYSSQPGGYPPPPQQGYKPPY
ncbi:unnamed protein product, partial [Closterium sp. Naga37s-1]